MTNSNEFPSQNNLTKFSDTELNTTTSSMNNPQNLDLNEIINSAYEQALKNRGHANILIAGRTGTGKSTLINAVFAGELATTGQGRPITQNTHEFKKPGIPLSIFDTRGLEVAEFKKTLEALDKCISERRNDDPNQYIHVAWVCISEESRRVERAEEELVEMLQQYGIPVIVVITKAMSDGGFKDEVLKILPSASNSVRVNSIATKLDSGIVIPPSGLKQLVDLTIQVIPEGQKSAFAASQKVDLEQKKSQSHQIVKRYALRTMTVGFVPMPIADAVFLIPIQVDMLAQISAIFGLSIDKGFLNKMVASTITGGLGSLAGKIIVGNLLEFIPVLGPVTGGVIKASVAASVTKAFGKSYIATLAALFSNNNGKPPTNEQVLEAFQKRNQ
ncbi:MAG: GTPase [Rivularia sp. (in: cyanobacteria)]